MDSGDGQGKKGCAAVGCASLGLVALFAAGAGVVWFSMGGEVPGLAPKAEVIEYDPVRDDPKGPSRVKPSGRSGLTLKTPSGVVQAEAEEIALARDISYANRPAVCRGNTHLTDLLKDVAFDLDREMRKATPMSASEESRLGDNLDQQIHKHPKFKGRIDTKSTRKWRAYLARVAQPLLGEVKRKDIEYRFHIVEDDTVNAFAIPGGHIYFFTGLLDNIGGPWLTSEAQLAGILAHEIGHVDLGHCAAVYQYLKRIGIDTGSKNELPAALILTLARGPFSSNQEDEADENATGILHNAQYDPDQFVEMWKTWDKLQPRRVPDDDFFTRELENLLQSHSPPKKRACTVLRRTQDLMETTPFDRFYIGRTNFERRVPRTRAQF